MADNVVTQRNIEENLIKIGLKEGDAVEVHASLRSVGRVANGQAAVVEALISVVTQTGTIVMSNYPLSRPLRVSAEEQNQGIAWKLRKLAEDSTEPTTTGVISDYFRMRPDVVCGFGTHRVCAWGRDAECHAKGYEHLVEVKGLVLLIGVDIDRCSSMHLSEKVETTHKARAKMDSSWGKDPSIPIPEHVRIQYPADILLGEEERGTSGNSWTNAREEAERRGLVKRGNIGGADSMLFRVKDMLALVENIRKCGPYEPSQD